MFTDKPVPAPQENEYKEVAWGVNSNSSEVKPLWINRWNVGENDVKIDMKFCGICHSDLHLAHNDLGGATYPMVPGHELIGTVLEVGAKVTKVKVGDNVGVGCMVDSCMDCKYCKSGNEQQCDKGCTWTYNSMKTNGHVGGNQETQTFGGYTGSHVCNEHFVCKIPDALPLEKAGPLMCAGITMYEPLKYHGATSGEKKTVGIIGIGGLGTMGIKLAKALGHRVVAISRTKAKEALALEKGADALIASTDEESMKTEYGNIDLILNTVSCKHEAGAYFPLLAKNGALVQLGLVPEPMQICQLPLIFNRISFTGSGIGGIANTEEMLALCAKHNILPDTQEITASKINWAWEQLEQNKDAIRYVINIKESLKDKECLPQ